MSQLLKYLIIALIGLGIGALTGILLYSHQSPAQLIKNGIHAGQEVKNLKKPPKSAHGAEKKESKESAGKEGKESAKEGDKKHDTAPATDKKEEHDKKTAAKKEEEKSKKDESTEYLRSLWPIKKRNPADVSGESQGPLYLQGTNPYGPPPTYKEELMAETKALTVPGSPPSRIPPPLPLLEKEAPLSAPDSLPTPSLYQIEIGRFSSLEKAKMARDLLRSKGHDVDVYYSGPITNPEWFYVRLSTFLSKPQAYQKAQTIAILEKIAPTIVAIMPDVKRLR
jgi:SPOR domain